MSFLAPPPSTSGSRRKSTSDLFRGMTVAKALAILKLTQREYAELSDERFRETFAKRQEAEGAAKEVLASKKANTSRPDLKHWQPPPPLVDHKKMMERSMKKHEAFQFLVKKRSVTRGEKQRSHEDSSCSESLTRTPSVGSWGSQDLSDIGDVASPAAKRRGSVLDYEYFTRGPMMVGPGTPPPILLPGMEDQQGGDEDQEEEKEEDLAISSQVIDKAEVTGTATTKSRKSQKKLIPFKVFINHPVTFIPVAVLTSSFSIPFLFKLCKIWVRTHVLIRPC